ncbi:MAG TPA: hypothetical protein VFB97_03945 [Bacteroidales bacterium]|nr:hypothetical protein [Bacteroidales bacterium]
MNKIITRNILLSVLLILLLFLVILAKGRTAFGKGESSFAVEQQNAITRIEFSEGEKKLVLEKQAEGWTVNGKHEARKSGISFMLRILAEIQIKSPLAPELFRSEIRQNNIAPVKVRIFENNRLLRSFLVYQTETNKYGNVMKRSESSKPFIVYVPGFEGDIGSAFTLNELFWQPFTVFRLLPSEISAVKLENITDPASAFSITNKCNIYTLSDMNGSLSGWDTAQVRRYLSYFAWIPFESWAADLPDPEKKKIESGPPVFRITVTRADGVETLLTLWERTIDSSVTKDSDRLWAKTGERDDLFIIRYFDIDPLLKKKSYFFAQ